ncbi:hypothetical protein Gotur_034761 [Gossypium turneri]
MKLIECLTWDLKRMFALYWERHVLMVMFSATWPAAVHQLAQEYMDPNLVKVVIGSEDLAANHDVMQIVEQQQQQMQNKSPTAVDLPQDNLLFDDSNLLDLPPPP